MATRKRAMPSRGHQNGNGTGTTKYRSYLYRPYQNDPIVESMRTVIGNTDAAFTELSERTKARGAQGVAPATISRLYRGITRRPMFNTVAATTLALGLSTIRLNRGKPIVE